ncbi:MULTISPECIES: ATP-binding protein [Sphingobium]|uniref:sensor histidine kinase n=1 Tax=Sphingobium TaxID=165695 RepID=UPI0015EC79A4|nr:MULTISPECIES: ATP-binding protein [Sphingobium]MCW2361768.1 two-component system nitrogen regulation sensor histidine kinase NtrY [Sphingobium sp. B10D3B]MCW2401553.1 two-component system nitrogen regulation sensor histidine kinase NtrY [Sphingobium sp. B10D7B]MCW2408533.1 two-component system nitrogen regulation sensor histidine kinase NtrY [Sphingobium xanthum]
MDQRSTVLDNVSDPSRPLRIWQRLSRLAVPLTAGVFVATAGFTWWLLTRPQDDDTLLSAAVVALLLVLNLLPAILLLVLLGQRIARRRANRSLVGGNGRLHVRLVALFSVIASLPLLLVVIFASLLFQYGVQFWFSADARGMLQNASDLARGYYQSNLKELSDETVTMAGDLRNYLSQSSISSPSFAEGYIYQVVTRKLNRSAIIEIGKDGVARTAATVDPERQTATDMLTPEIIRDLRNGQPVVVQAKPNQIEAFVLLYPESNTFLYATRDSAVSAFSEMERAQAVLADYDEFAARSRQLQLRFNIALFIGTLMLVGTAVWIALAVADRLVRPVGELVDAARRVTAGDLSARVTDSHSRDELGTLASAFNRMTQRLEAQTGALVSANNQLADRRALIEAVLSGVSAGVVSVDRDGTIQILNSSAAGLLVRPGEQAVGQRLADVSEELAALMEAGTGADIIQIRARGEVRTLAVRVVVEDGNQVLTFDDITEQLLDQRRAAWSDVARRIAHEIKNPLTPIQLAAERLQRRYGKEIESDPSTFRRLTETIVRQVGDLRRIVDEFTSFARMPKPVFREEAVIDIARHAMFLHEVAHPEITFTFASEEADPALVCDRRQIGQALTNIVKNAVEAIEQRHLADAPKGEGDQQPANAQHGHVTMLVLREEGQLAISVTDDGIGLPEQRERIIEPYMTTRAKGTGLGLAIVKKIVEEHFGSITFGDAESGGTVVTLRFDVERLSRLAEGDERAETI